MLACLPMRVDFELSEWKMAWANGILYRTYKVPLFGGKCSKNVVSLTAQDIQYNNGLVQDCGNSSADALELPQSCTKPLVNPPQHGSDGIHLQSIPAQQFRRLHLAWSGPSLDGSTSPGCTELPQIAEGLIKSPPLLCQ